MRRASVVAPVGKCQCGCGGDTAIARTTWEPFGHVKGEPKKYLRGHGTRLSNVDYLEEDRGYKTPCWIWQRARSKAGYGLTKVNGKTFNAHRVYYERVHGPQLFNVKIDHLCRIRECVNVEHLEGVTNAVNSRRGNMTRLRPKDLEQIKAMRAAGIMYVRIADAFDITPQHASVICRGKTWVVP